MLLNIAVLLLSTTAYLKTIKVLILVLSMMSLVLQPLCSITTRSDPARAIEVLFLSILDLMLCKLIQIILIVHC